MPTSTSTTSPRSAGTCRPSSRSSSSTRPGVQTAVIMTITDAPEVNPTALEMIADVCARWPGRFEAYARIHPWYGDEAERLLVRAIRELRFVGLKLHPVTTIAHPADESSLRLIRAAARLGAPTHDPLRRRPVLHAARARAGRDPRARGDDRVRPHGRVLPQRGCARRRRALRERHARDLGLPVSGADRRGRAPRRRRARDLRLGRPRAARRRSSSTRCAAPDSRPPTCARCCTRTSAR